MKNYLFIGDTHADLDFVQRAAEMAAEYECPEMIHVGDWGFLWPGRGGDMRGQLSGVLAMAGEKYARPPVTMRFIDGNHDWHPKLNAILEDGPWWGDGRSGVEISPHVIYQPRGSTYTDEDGTRFLFCGGACSIDQAFRVEGLSWWPEETITSDDYERARSADGPFHVFVTHDAPDYPPGFEPKGSASFRQRSAQGMEYLRRLNFHHSPELHVHGHWHSRYSRMYGPSKVVGLDCNYGALNDAVMLWSRT